MMHKKIANLFKFVRKFELPKLILFSKCIRNNSQLQLVTPFNLYRLFCSSKINKGIFIIKNVTIFSSLQSINVNEDNVIYRDIYKDTNWLYSQRE